MPVWRMAGSADFSNYFSPLSDAVTATSLEEAKKQGRIRLWQLHHRGINFLILGLISSPLVKMGWNNLRKRLEKQKAAGPAAPLARRRATPDRDPRSAREEARTWIESPAALAAQVPAISVSETSNPDKPDFQSTQIRSENSSCHPTDMLRAEARRAPVSGIEAVASYWP